MWRLEETTLLLDMAPRMHALDNMGAREGRNIHLLKEKSYNPGHFYFCLDFKET